MSKPQFAVGEVVAYTNTNGKIDLYLIVPGKLAVAHNGSLPLDWAKDRSWGLFENCDPYGKPIYRWMLGDVKVLA